jgi:hypothetical protein
MSWRILFQCWGFTFPRSSFLPIANGGKGDAYSMFATKVETGVAVRKVLGFHEVHDSLYDALRILTFGESKIFDGDRKISAAVAAVMLREDYLD